jgi:hypothetical protein
MLKHSRSSATLGTPEDSGCLSDIAMPISEICLAWGMYGTFKMSIFVCFIKCALSWDPLFKVQGKKKIVPILSSYYLSPL